MEQSKNLSKEELKTLRATPGRIHSLETFGSVDGPGIRYVVFLQGCLLHCLYCHNPDSISAGRGEGQLTTAGEMVDEIMQYTSFIENGGVTLSGGEPLLQVDFVCAVIQLLKYAGLQHVAIDTCGAVALEKCRKAIDLSDLILLDIKAWDSKISKQLTGMDNQNSFKLLDYCEQISKPVWIRHVLLPGYTLDFAQLEPMAEYLTQYSCVEKIEFLPFHKMGEYKWEALGKKYLLYDTPAPTNEEIAAVKSLFSSKNLTVH